MCKYVLAVEGKIDPATMSGKTGTRTRSGSLAIGFPLLLLLLPTLLLIDQHLVPERQSQSGM